MSLEPAPPPSIEYAVPPRGPSTAAVVVGWVLSAMPIIMLGGGGVYMAVTGAVGMKQGMVHLGYPDSIAPTLMGLEIACVVLYAIPQTAVLGAILMTGYLGGAVASHVRVLESQWVGGAIFGVIAWLGLYLRDPRVRALVPLRRV